MSTIRKTIILTSAQDGWIKAQIDAGKYTNDSEAIRDLIRKAQAETRAEDIEAVRAALIEGEQSGLSDKTPDQIWRETLARKKAQGDLAL